MENYYVDAVEIGILKGKLADPVRGDKPYQTIAVDDIGAFGVLAFERPRDFLGVELEIAGKHLTHVPAARGFARVRGKRVKVQKHHPLPARLDLPPEYYQIVRLV